MKNINKKDAKSINQNIQTMIKSNKKREQVLKYVKSKCQLVSLTPMTLGMLFELIADMHPDENDLTTFFSKKISIEELKNIHPGFESSNGCQWARSDVSYLGKKYVIKRIHKGNRVYEVQMDGPNKNSMKRYRFIRADIREYFVKQNCAILDISSNIEIDHKNGRYDELTNTSLETQKKSEFQPLCKAANDAKRQHCRECREKGKRYDARNLGFSFGWIAGDENTESCVGCYWYDPYVFNKKISADFNKL